MADPINAEKIARMRGGLLAWYDRARRDLPWRRTQDPYAIWVSEIMLQQTRVAAVVAKYKVFLERFPTVKDLAQADEQDVLALWSGLGYYRRARMLHKAAKQVVAELGAMPSTAKELRKLAGIGSYTAAAIASIAFSEPVAAVDGNVERVLSRVRGWESHDSVREAAVRRKVDAFASDLVDPRRPGDFNQALMELGATVCAPRSPQCLVCPWAAECRTLGEHRTPKRAPMTSREVGCMLVVRECSEGDEVLLEQRATTNTVMPGMWELPALADVRSNQHKPIMIVRHAIMQVNYTVRVWSVAPEEIAVSDAVRRWVPLREAAAMALTGLARKVLARAGMLDVSVRKNTPGFAAPETAGLV
ncbi:MAG TPA: A/G-specific adenine glycosylase [Terracidiphilus sp.]|nr:A/G-specific adenine glycosylase [Terracidiphilus sp.]